MKKKVFVTIGIMMLLLVFTACGKEQPKEAAVNAGNITEEETMDIPSNASDEGEASEEESEESTEKKEDKKKSSKKKKEELVDGMRPEFKEAMDSYEEFFDEYCKFMKKYAESSDQTSLLVDYTNYLAKYADVMDKMDKLGEDNLNDAELKYYTEVTLRINEKLLDVAVE